jgi:hypothetical protein
LPPHVFVPVCVAFEAEESDHDLRATSLEVSSCCDCSGATSVVSCKYDNDRSRVRVVSCQSPAARVDSGQSHLGDTTSRVLRNHVFCEPKLNLSRLFYRKHATRSDSMAAAIVGHEA